MKFIWVFSSILILLLATADQSNAEIPLRDGPFFGYTFGGGVCEASPAFGYQVVYDFGKHLSLEANGTRQTDKLSGNVGNYTLPSGVNIPMTMYSVATTLRAEYEVIQDVTLFGGAGGGYYILRTKTSSYYATEPTPEGPLYINSITINAKNNWGWHLVAGCQYQISPHWELFFEGRLVFLTVHGPVHLQGDYARYDYGEMNFPNSLNYNHCLLRLGINYQF